MLTKDQVWAFIAAYQSVIKTKDPDGIRALLNTFVDKIVVTKDRVHTYLKVFVVGLLVPKVGFEPTQACAYCALNTACLPFHHFGVEIDDMDILSQRINAVK